MSRKIFGGVTPCRECGRPTMNNETCDVCSGRFAPAPAEPVTLTPEESADLDDLLHKWLPFTDRIPQPSHMVERWLREHGFRLVRTGGAADGA